MSHLIDVLSPLTRRLLLPGDDTGGWVGSSQSEPALSRRQFPFSVWTVPGSPSNLMTRRLRVPGEIHRVLGGVERPSPSPFRSTVIAWESFTIRVKEETRTFILSQG